MKVSLYCLFIFHHTPHLFLFGTANLFLSSSLIYNHMLDVGMSPFWVLASVLPVNHCVTLASISPSVVSSYFLICAMSGFFCLRCKDQPSFQDLISSCSSLPGFRGTWEDTPYTLFFCAPHISFYPSLLFSILPLSLVPGPSGSSLSSAHFFLFLWQSAGGTKGFPAFGMTDLLLGCLED